MRKGMLIVVMGMLMVLGSGCLPENKGTSITGKDNAVVTVVVVKDGTVTSSADEIENGSGDNLSGNETENKRVVWADGERFVFDSMGRPVE